MIRVLVTLAVITALTAAAAHFGYQELEKRLQASSCLPAQAAGTGGLRKDNPDSAPEQEPVPAAQNFQIIVSRDIFRSALADKQEKKPALKPEPPPVSALPTSLNLTLVGSVIGSGQTSRAIIISNIGRDQKQQLLQIGDGVPGTAAVIKKIAWESVTLEVNGREEILTMPKPKSVPGFGPQAMLMPPEPVMLESSAESGNMRQGRQPVRPNRRISLPPEEPTTPAEIIDHEAPPRELPIEMPPQEEIPPPELPPEQEIPLPDVE